MLSDGRQQLHVSKRGAVVCDAFVHQSVPMSRRCSRGRSVPSDAECGEHPWRDNTPPFTDGSRSRDVHLYQVFLPQKEYLSTSSEESFDRRT